MSRPSLVALALSVAACPGPKPAPDVDLPAPGAGQGFQLVAGPFDVASGTEVQRCYFFAAPDGVTWVNRVQTGLNPGSHHLNLFRVKTVVNLSGKPGDMIENGECFNSSNWADWPLVTNQQDSTAGRNVADWTYPTGVAQRFAPGELLMLQIHYVNASTQKTPGRGKGVVNFFSVDAGAVTAELGTMNATNQNIEVCPGDTDRHYSATCFFSAASTGAAPVTIVAANGHFHSRGTDFTMSVEDAQGTVAPAPFYENLSWNEPVFERGLNVVVPTGGGVQWVCHYGMGAGACGDPAKSCCCTFGGHVETQEHCNAFVYYYPKTGDVTCF